MLASSGVFKHSWFQYMPTVQHLVYNSCLPVRNNFSPHLKVIHHNVHQRSTTPQLYSAYLGSMHLAVPHDQLSTVFHRHTISLTSHITIIKCHSAILDHHNSLIIIPFLLKCDVLDADVTCTEFHREFIIITAKHYYEITGYNTLLTYPHRVHEDSWGRNWLQ